MPLGTSTQSEQASWTCCMKLSEASWNEGEDTVSQLCYITPQHWCIFGM